MYMDDRIIGGPEGYLEVFVRKAKDLPNMRKMDKQDPFVRLRIAHLTEVSGTVFRGGQRPVFDFHTVFELTPAMKHLMYVELFDDQKSAPRIIGRCEVDLKPALYSDHEDGYDRWYQLSLGPDDAGKIYIELTFKQHTIRRKSQIQPEPSPPPMTKTLKTKRSPPLPSEIPYVPFPKDQLQGSISQSGFTYTHGGGMSQPLPALRRSPDTLQYIPRNPALPQVEQLKLPEFVLSVDTLENFDAHTSQQSEGTGITAKLKQLKEKWNNFKQGSPEQNDAARANVDLEELQKVVGVKPDFPKQHGRMRSRHSISSGLQPALPPLPQPSDERTKLPGRRPSPHPDFVPRSPSPGGQMRQSRNLVPLPPLPHEMRNTRSLSPVRRPPVF
ncbi:AFR057Cp [Eremothecium gossypii ATCC 10895]|uniref:AFR057Cp n=1 Tax=Eremothecium gossypii (strain ATCC 10895 / CBS 109.51 / FGSC 9923 / NRRL Y-1056) TaxID=284811 RepID=Q754L5_EREGS|nr:AFR057Cp [Eremothecium gossypii ATCC 10895]AAS53428.2 AFR057Cp [Eremothecium gossypii ATCC 10895]AEY97740.1 FAFR057Cp [Eremothecium gossypii FDAG1]